MMAQYLFLATYYVHAATKDHMATKNQSLFVLAIYDNNMEEVEDHERAPPGHMSAYS